jgi:hypothetical protein
MGRIQTLPIGYLDALGLKTTGVNPPNTLDSVTPVVDMLPFYFGDNVDSETNLFTGVVSGTDVSISVPAGEAWIPLAASYNVIRDAVNIQPIETSIGFVVRNNFVRTGVINQTTTLSVTGQMVTAVWNPAFHMLLPAGSVIRGRLDVGGAGVNAFGELDVAFIRLTQ